VKNINHTFIFKRKYIKKILNYLIRQEDKYYVAQCLNADVSSFGETLDEAIQNIIEAVELFFSDEI